MGLIYADTSAPIKRHITERGSAWVRGWIGPEHGNTIVIAEIAVPETISALARLRRQPLLSARSFARLRERSNSLRRKITSSSPLPSLSFA